MNVIDNSKKEEQKYVRAKKRVEDLKAYYWHIAFYVIVNLFLSIAQIIDGISEDKSFTEIFSDIGIYGVWLLWGIGIFFHTLKMFGSNIFLGRDWEEQKIKEIMDKGK